MQKFVKTFIVFISVSAVSLGIYAQAGKVKLDGYGRFYMSENSIGGNIVNNDTVTAKKAFTGVGILDLNFQANPNKKTEIVALVRASTVMGDIWGGATQYTQLVNRQLYVRGIVGDALRYRLGDIYVENTPYTTYSPSVLGQENEAGIFSMYKEYINYNNFYHGNKQHMMGGNADMAFTFKSIVEEVKLNAYMSRNGSTTPETWYGGANVKITQSKAFDLGINFVDMFGFVADNAKDKYLSNPVNTLNFAIKFGDDRYKLKILGEFGTSTYEFKNDSVNKNNKLNGSFYDIGAVLEVDKFKVKASYRSVDADFRSLGAQSLRADFGATPQLFTKLGNTQVARPISILDLTKDENVYSTTFNPTLANYKSSYVSANPYGVATPNRQGVNARVDYGSYDDKIHLFGDVSMLTEMRGVDVENSYRSFTLLYVGANFNINKMLGFEKMLRLSVGYKMENTTRSADSTYAKVDLANSQIDLGLEYEFAKGFDVILGMKMFAVKGNDVTYERDPYSKLYNPAIVYTSNEQTLYAGGIRYRFSPDIYLTAQAQYFDFKQKLSDIDMVKYSDTKSYNIQQFILLYTMKF